MKISLSRKNPPTSVLLTVEFVKSQVEIETQLADVTSLTVNSEFVFNTPATICRYLARVAENHGLYGNSILEQTEIDHWLSFSSLYLGCPAEFNVALNYLDHVLGPLTFLVGHSMTIGDIIVWSALHEKSEFLNLLSQKRAPNNVMRYYKFLATKPEFQRVINYLSTSSNGQETSQSAKKEWKEEGKFVELPGAEKGKVVVRFPPEASGFLHIGHAKAALLNQYYQQAFEGKLIMRFDDTNPEKENAEFEEVILEDIKLLGIKPDIFTYTSDHFDKLIEYCTQMIREKKAYADDTEPEIMKQEREERKESVNRNNSVEKNLQMWEEMKKGSVWGVKCCIRAKIDMASNNGCMRDPTMYRCKPEPHVRTGYNYKVYPTYDFACPIVDSVEQVTHALRTMEYHDRDEQYFWFLETLKLRKPYLWEYSRLNLQNTVMSKRKLTWFVDQGLVEGWDDPRFPTVRGVMRRGMTVEGMKQFVIAQGSSRSINMMDWDKIWAFNKKVIDPVAPRFTALQKDSVVPVLIKGVAEEVKEALKHPKNPEVGMKHVWYSSQVLIEGADAEELHVGETVTFINWGNLVIRGIKRSPEGRIESVEADLNLENKDYKKTQKITWLTVTDKAPLVSTVCVMYDHLISKPVLGRDEDFKQYINKNSREETILLGDPELAKLKKGDIIQLQRRGYFICDSAYELASPYSGLECPCVLLNIPDGHVKEMPTAGSKHKPSSKEMAQDKKGKSAEKSPQEEMTPVITQAVSSLYEQIAEQGTKIRTMKSEKAAKGMIDSEVKLLLKLKEEYKASTGLDWKPLEEQQQPVKRATTEKKKNDNGAAAVVVEKVQPAMATQTLSSDEAELRAKIEAQGNHVREIKASSAPKEEIDVEVKILLNLKAQYKELTGADLPPVPAGGKKDKSAKEKTEKKKAEEKPNKGKKGNEEKETNLKRLVGAKEDNVVQIAEEKKKEAEGKAKEKQVNSEPAAEGAIREVKKVTRLGLEVKKEDNFSEWYSQVITKSEMIEYYDISGCYVLRQWAFGIWEKISQWFDEEIKKIGFQNCYFPMFVSQSALQTEKEHIDDFAPEVAWVTRSGDTDLAEPIAIRPTSETVMYPSYARWVQSHRDLPIKLNQWCSVVRWEFKHPQPFLRTREFLWQEGHSAYATCEEAEKEVYYIIDLYEYIYENLLAVPVIKGKKTQKEKFAGGDYTTTVEAYIAASGRGIQAATSHHLGQNFSKMFNIVFEDPDTREKRYAYQNSWAITTRSIGIIVMVHGDNKGLVLPPRIAPIQVVLVPCGVTAQLSETERKQLTDKCQWLAELLQDTGIRVRGDYRDNYSPGWKFNHWELKGVPLRIELGPRDVQLNQFIAVRRDNGDKQTIKLNDAVDAVSKLLENIHQSMFAKAKNELENNTALCTDFTDLCNNLDKNKLILAPFCGGIPCEENIKKLSARDAITEDGAPAMGAKGLCIPFKQPVPIGENDKCIGPECQNKPTMYTLFGKSY